MFLESVLFLTFAVATISACSEVEILILAIICATQTKSQKKPEWKDLASSSCRCRVKPKIYVPYYYSELLKLYARILFSCNQCEILTGIPVQPEIFFIFFYEAQPENVY
jgi:hypothetical protein